MPTIAEQLDRERRELLDLSTRNRLLSMPVDSRSAKVVQVRDEVSDEVYRLLVEERRVLGFAAQAGGEPAAGVGEDPEESEDAVEAEADDDILGREARHSDRILQTGLSREGLQRRLLALYRDARTLEEEQGVNILYLALGALQWYEADDSHTARYAPLLLVPVRLERQTVRDRFTLRWREEEVQENLSLESLLHRDFGLCLPALPEAESWTPSEYVRDVAKTVAGRARWKVLPNTILLGFFSFAKFLMYRDLDPANWPSRETLPEHPLVRALLQDGFSRDQVAPSDERPLDEWLPVERLDQVVDADSSQTVAIERARAGENLVIQGPPGTGKSQSIANILATAVRDGKRVLFVAEKMAALEVVKRRLEAIGLGDLCLELHSHKAHKRAVIEEIGRTWRLGAPRGRELAEGLPRLRESRDALNRHVQMLHTPLEPCGWTPWELLGLFTRVAQQAPRAAGWVFPGVERWNRETLRTLSGVIDGLSSQAQRLGAIERHPWKGVESDSLKEFDLPVVEMRLRELLAKIRDLEESVAQASDSTSQPRPVDFRGLADLRRLGRHLLAAPAMDPAALTAEVWTRDQGAIAGALAAGRLFAQRGREARQCFREPAWDADFHVLEAEVREHSVAPLRFLPDWLFPRASYRAAIRNLRLLSVGPLPPEDAGRLTAIATMLAAQQARADLREQERPGAAAFGVNWKGEESNWDELESVAAWVRQGVALGLEPEARRVRAGLSRPEALEGPFRRLQEAEAALRASLTEVGQFLRVNLPVACGHADGETLPWERLTARIGEWLENLDELPAWCDYQHYVGQARSHGLGPLLEAVASGACPATEVRVHYQRALLSQLLRELFRQRPGLAQFDGLAHDRLVESFRELDRQRLHLARFETLAAHHARLPQRAGNLGGVGLLLGEIQRRRGHLPVRRLLAEAGTVVQQIKPVFMMSPLSVAQFLAPGALSFDLLVIDEASQVQPVDALGAIARARQMVVVGDQRQLPPTRFFARLTGEEEPEDREETGAQAAPVRDLESILGLCSARGVPDTMLRWHYRSRHHSLIAVSNREFYGNGLFVVPSPRRESPDLGLRIHRVPDGTFDAGGTGTNHREAQTVARAVIEHARRHPRQSLGVAAFSVRQQQAILDQLELLRRENPDTEEFFHTHPEEPFFVKNLESVQGDERDVILISIGYAPNPQGYMAMRFGPLGNEGGERRLNVLISRAKWRCEVFVSFASDAIDLQRANGRGVHALKAFLQYAETGRMQIPRSTGGEEQSPFEESVRLAVETLGYEVHPQVGIAGFYIDLGVVDPDQPGRYLLGIECDGATYHSARSARDRDRLRQAVLESHGWIIHRIWSTDWFKNPREQLRRLAGALEEARERQPDDGFGPPSETAAEDPPELAREDPGEEDVGPALALGAVPYVVANFVPDRTLSPVELPIEHLVPTLARIVRIESPIHEDELVVRVRDLWGWKRASARLQERVQDAIGLLARQPEFHRADSFLSVAGADIAIRDRSASPSPTLRRPDRLPPREIQAAIRKIVELCHGAEEDRLVKAVTTALGLRTATSALSDLIQRQIQLLVRQGALRRLPDGTCQPPERA